MYGVRILYWFIWTFAFLLFLNDLKLFLLIFLEFFYFLCRFWNLLSLWIRIFPTFSFEPFYINFFWNLFLCFLLHMSSELPLISINLLLELLLFEHILISSHMFLIHFFLHFLHINWSVELISHFVLNIHLLLTLIIHPLLLLINQIRELIPKRDFIKEFLSEFHFSKETLLGIQLFLSLSSLYFFLPLFSLESLIEKFSFFTYDFSVITFA